MCTEYQYCVVHYSYRYFPFKYSRTFVNAVSIQNISINVSHITEYSNLCLGATSKPINDRIAETRLGSLVIGLDFYLTIAEVLFFYFVL